MHNGLTFLQSKSGGGLPSGSMQNFTQATHPTVGLIRGYLLRITGTIQSAAADVTPTYEQWKDTILEAAFDVIQLLAPRYNNALCTANLTAGYWCKLYEDLYGYPMPIIVSGVQVTPAAGVLVTTAAPVAFEVDLFIPFERPKLGPDRLFSAPPCTLFAGDVNLNFRWQTTGGSIGGHAQTIAAVQVNWYVDVARGDNGRVPVIHRFERKTYSSDSIDVGRGWPFFITDNAAPDDTVRYDVMIDGQNINNLSLTGLDIEAQYRIENSDEVAENRVYTPLLFMADNSTVDELHFASRSVAFKFYGKSSGTLDMHFADPPGSAVKSAALVALGQSAAAASVALPVTPKTASLGNVERVRAIAGPRTLHLKQNGGNMAVPQSTRTVPTVPSGTLGAGIASASNRK